MLVWNIDNMESSNRFVGTISSCEAMHCADHGLARLEDLHSANSGSRRWMSERFQRMIVESVELLRTRTI